MWQPWLSTSKSTFENEDIIEIIDSEDEEVDVDGDEYLPTNSDNGKNIF